MPAMTNMSGAQGVQPPNTTARKATNAAQPQSQKNKVGEKKSKRLYPRGQKRKADQISRSHVSYEYPYHILAQTRFGEDRTPTDPTPAELISAGTNLDSIKASIYSLKNEPHPLFRNIEWEEPPLPGIKTGLGGNDRGFYQDILPALQIASKVIFHPDVLPFWHGLFESHRTNHRQGLDPQFSAKRRLTK